MKLFLISLSVTLVIFYVPQITCEAEKIQIISKALEDVVNEFVSKNVQFDIIVLDGAVEFASEIIPRIMRVKNAQPLPLVIRFLMKKKVNSIELSTSSTIVFAKTQDEIIEKRVNEGWTT